MYIQFGHCFDNMYSKRYELDIRTFRGIKITSRHCMLVFDDHRKENRGAVNACVHYFCGPTCFGANLQIFNRASNDWVYYDVARFCREKYGDRSGYDMRFSIPNGIKSILRIREVDEYGLLSKNSGWKDCQNLSVNVLI